MPDPRTEVRVVFIPEIKLPDEDIHIPVVLDPEAGAAPSGTGLPSGFRGGLTAILGGAMAARIAGAMQSITAVVKVISAGGPYTIAAVAALAAAFAGVVVQVYAAVKAIQLLWSIGKTALRGLTTLVKTLADAFINLATWAVQKSIDVLEDFVKSIRNVGNAVKTHITSFLKTAIKTFAEFEQQAANTVAVMGITGDAAVQMRDQVMALAEGLTEMSRRTETEAVEAMYHLASAGFSTLKQLENLTRAGITLSEATLSPLAETTEFLASTINMWNLQSEEAMRITNALVAAITKSPALMKKLADSFQYVGSTAYMYGLSIEQLTGYLMAMFKTGVKGSRAGMELQNVFNTLAKQTDKAVSVLKEYGVALDETSIASQGLGAVLREFEKIGKRLQQQYGEKVGLGKLAEMLQKAFTMRAGRGLARILTQGVDQAEAFTGAITGTTTALQIQQDQLLTLQGHWDILSSLWRKTYMDVLRGELGPAFIAFYGTLRDMVNVIRDTGIFKAFGVALGEIVYAARDMVIALGPTLLQSLQQIAAILPSVAQGFIAAFVEVLPTAIKLIQELPGLLLHFFQALIPLVLRFARDVLPQLLKFALTVIPRLIDLFSTLGIALLDLVAQNGDLVIAWFNALLQVGQAIVNVLPQLLPTIRALAPAFAQLVVKLLALTAEVLPQLLPALQTLANMFLNLGAAGVMMAIQTLMDFTNVLNSALPLAQALTNRLLFLSGVFTSNFPAAIELVTKILIVMGYIVDLIGKQFGGLNQTVAQTIAWLDQNLVPALRTGLIVLAEFFDVAKGGVYILSLIPAALFLWGVAMAPIYVAVLALTGLMAGLTSAITGVLELINMIPGVNIDEAVKSAQAIRDAFWESTKAMVAMPDYLKAAAIAAPRVAQGIAGVIDTASATARGVAGGLGPQGGYGPGYGGGYGASPQLAPVGYRQGGNTLHMEGLAIPEARRIANTELDRWERQTRTQQRLGAG